MLSGTLGPNFLGNLLTCKRTIISDKGTSKVDENF